MKAKTIIKICVPVVAVIGLAVGGYFAYNYWQGQKRMTVMTEVMSNIPATEQAVITDIKAIVSATGTICLKDEQSIYSATEAKVSEVMVEVGDIVTEGQTLVKYDAENQRDTLEKQIAKAEINLSTQELSVKSMTLPATDSEIKQLKNAVDNAAKSVFDFEATLANTNVKINQQEEAIKKAEKELAEAEDAIDVNKQLLEVGGISQSEYENFITARDKAAENVTSAVNAMEELLRQKESNEMNIKTAEKSLLDAEKNLDDASIIMKDEVDRIKYEQQLNNVKTSKLELQNYKDQLEDVIDSTESTLNGTVTSVQVTRGKKVDYDTVLMTVADFNQLIAKANISEYDVPSITVGQMVNMTTDGLEGITYTGKIIKIGDSASTQAAVSGTETVVPIEVSIDNADGKIKPGFSLDMEIIVSEKKNVLTVSIGAVQKDTETNSKYVYVVGDRRILTKTDVTTGTQDDMVVEIVMGLSENDEVVSTPTTAMQDGMSLMAAGGMEIPEMNRSNQSQNGMGVMGGVRIGGGGGGNVTRSIGAGGPPN